MNSTAISIETVETTTRTESYQDNRKYDLICFDFDGTLAVGKDNLVFWSLLQQRFNIPQELDDKRRALHREGRLSASEWVDQNIHDWIQRDITQQQIENAIKEDLKLHKNAQEVLQRLKEEGVKLALISNSMSIALHTLLPKDTFDHCLIGEIQFDQEGKIKDWEHKVTSKAEAIMQLAEQEGIHHSRIAFVGDDLNDLGAMRLVGLGVAFNARHDLVKQEANIIIDDPDYLHLLQHFLHRV